LNSKANYPQDMMDEYNLPFWNWLSWWLWWGSTSSSI